MMRMSMQHSNSFLFILLFIAGIVLSGPSTPSRSRVRRQNMKVRINATGDTIVLKFLRPNADTKLEGYILGYGSSMFSKQFIQLPENGQPYETEFDAEPKYLIAVQPIPVNEVKKQCTGKVELEKPLHLVIGSVTPTSVLLSWGTLLKTPYESNVMNDCLEDGHYTVRYRERSRKWNYQTCPTSDTVIDNLKPNTVYEFGVQPNSKDGDGHWSQPVIHNVSMEEKARKPIKRPITPVPLTTGQHSLPFAHRHASPNRTQGRVPLSRNIVPKTTLAPTTTTRQDFLSTPGPAVPVVTKRPFGGEDLSRSVLPPLLAVPLAPKFIPQHNFSTTKAPMLASVSTTQKNVERLGHSLSQRKPKPQRKVPQPTRQTQQPRPKPPRKTQPHPKTHFQTEPQSPKIQSTTQPLPIRFTSLPVPQTQPQSQSTTQTHPKLQPQQTSKPIIPRKLQPQPLTTSPHIAETTSTPKPMPQTHPHLLPHETSQPATIIQSQFNSQPKPRHQPNPQPTPQISFEPQPQPPPLPKQQPPSRTKPQLKTQTQLSPQIQPTPHVTPVIQTQTTKPTPQRTTQTHQALTDTHIQPQHKPQYQSTGQPQTQPQPKSNRRSKPPTPPNLNTVRHSKAQPTPKSKVNDSVPKPKTQHQSKIQPKVRPQSQPKKPPKTHHQHKTKHQPKLPQPQDHLHKIKAPPVSESQPTLPTHLLPKAQPPSLQSLPVPLPKPNPAPKPQPQLPPGLQPQTRSNPTTVTPRHAAPTAPSPPEEGKPLPRPVLAAEKASSNNQGTGILRSSTAAAPRSSISSSFPPAGRKIIHSRTRVPPNPTRNGDRTFSPSKTFTSSRSSSTPGAGGAHHRGNAIPKPVVGPKEEPALHPSSPVNKRPNLVRKHSDHDKPMDLKQGDKESILKPFSLVTVKPKQEYKPTTTSPVTEKQEYKPTTTTTAPLVNTSRFDLGENSSIFRPLPTSDVDVMGKKRFVAPHVIYKTDKKPDEPCSITSSLAYFPDEENNDLNVTGPPRIPPSNVTVVTVEGCPSFVILDWQKSDNETREYEVVSTTKGPNGKEVSVLTTNQTHTAVENLKPESSYEFKVTPKNELGTGPSSDPVSFSTESADPRVSEYVAGKDAIWTQFPFKADAYSECNGKQFVKRTWYRKFVGIQLCNSLRYKIYLSDTLNGKFYNIGDQTGHGEDHCQFVDSFLDGRTGTQMFADQLPSRSGYFRALRQEPVHFGEIGGKSHITYVGWYECGTPIPGKW
ncbi:target of Nesh-SH3 isoform X2 [Sphaeramia orbicularis]|uniref:target of Nesh-SH3 isoform X2 n=1 Tax=Sphaeramia orbicularis TaxID=375764 RepID=UPI00117D72D4|nr:target of Nesh-SH3-like isoform X2 [Sphaeramia orbicularis]